MTSIDIGVACSGFQTHMWWSKVMAYLLLAQKQEIEINRIFAVASAVRDHAKSHAVGAEVFAPFDQKSRNESTDANRVAIVGAKASGGGLEETFWTMGADYLLFLDDDTVPPRNFIKHLVNLGRPFVAGLYFMAKPPYNPIAYTIRDDGLYHAFYNYPLGALVQVDSVGMGCTLIHRSVFEKIIEEHTVFQRPDGSLIPIHNSEIQNNRPPNNNEQYVKNGRLHMPLYPVEEDDNRAWPFFVMEYGRTEDHWFNEMACRVGFRPWLDTNVVCDHIKPQATNRAQYLEELNKKIRSGEL